MLGLFWIKCLGSAALKLTKYLVKSNEEMSSDFIARTCEVVPKSYSPSSHHRDDLIMMQDSQPIQYMIVSGSRAEFYIRPLNTCIGDIDMLLCRGDQLAFNGDFPVLPSNINSLADTVQCYEIEPCHGFPGFVRLRDFGEMKYNWKHKEYKLIRNINPDSYHKIDRTENLNSLDKDTLSVIVCGPAIKSLSDARGAIIIDAVNGIFCPQWPRDAQTWPLRPRHNGWPTSGIISKVVRNGYYVVYSQHRACRDDERQWRLSFSVAEVILLQSWTKTQQIVYHLLRFFAKRELIKEDCPKEDEVLCPYHLKTLMLWTCEEMSPEWWDSSPVIAICCELLNILSEWLQRRHFPNYFIPEANLFHHPSTSILLDQTERRVSHFRNYGILCRWFVENYILPITRTRFQFLNTGNVTPDFMDYMLPLLEFRKETMPVSLEIVVASTLRKSNWFYRCEIKTQRLGFLHMLLHMQQIDGNSYFILFEEAICLPTLEKVLCTKYYDMLLHCLQFAYYLSNGEISWDCRLLVEFVQAMSLQPKVIMSQYHKFPRTSRAEGSRYQFMRAQSLIENLTGYNGRSEFQLVSLMSKDLLRRISEAGRSEFYDDITAELFDLAALPIASVHQEVIRICSEYVKTLNADLKSVRTAASVYLAALHFASSDYQEAIRLCSAVLVDRTPEEEKETLNAGCLLFIDDVARIVGLCVLHKKITNINLHCIGRYIYLDWRISPEVFAHYLTVLSSERMSTHLDFGRDFPDLSFPMDSSIKALIKPNVIAKVKLHNDARPIVNDRMDFLTEAEAAATNLFSIVKETVIDLLMEIAFENMTSFYSVILKDFGIQCNTVDCYRALYLYKCLKYDGVLHLCEKILNEPDLCGSLQRFSFEHVMVIPPFHAFFDGDVQSLLGFHTLFYYLSPLNDDLHKSDITRDSTFEHWFAKCVKFEKEALDRCLFQSCPIKYRYFMGRHFLARYLKVRCCIDRSLPYEEVMTEFSDQPKYLPFERMLRRFLLQRPHYY